MTVCHFDCVTVWLCDSMTVWQHDCVTIWLCDCMTVWQYDCVTVWLCDRMTVQQYDCVTAWLCDSMTVGQHDCVTICLCDYITVWQYGCVTAWLCDNMTVWLWRTTSRSMRRRWAGVGRWAGLVAGWEMPGRGKAKAADLSSGAVIAFLNIYQQKTYQGSSSAHPVTRVRGWPSRDDVTRTRPPWVRPPVDCWQRAGLSVIVRGNDASKQCCTGVRVTTELGPLHLLNNIRSVPVLLS